MVIEGLEHVQLAMPAGRESDAIAFYEGLLGIASVAKPARLAGRGGCWFETDRVKVHLGVDPNFVAAQKAHPALLVSDLAAVTARLEQGGATVIHDGPNEGMQRAYVDDPFGNRIELVEPIDT